MTTQKTHNMKHLYFQLLKPKGIPISELPKLVTLLYEHHFIDLLYTPEFKERYIELEKYTMQTHRA